MTNPETLLAYAKIFEKPRRFIKDGPLTDPSEIDRAAAKALRFMAEKHKIEPDGPPCPKCGYKIVRRERPPFVFEEEP